MFVNGQYSYSIEARVQQQTVLKNVSRTYDGNNDVEVNYTLSSDADKVEITVRDSNGTIVATDTGKRSSGTHTYSWGAAGEYCGRGLHY